MAKRAGSPSGSQQVTGRLSDTSAPLDVVVTRVASAAVEFGPVTEPPPANDGAFAAFLHEIWLAGGYWQHWFSCTVS